MPWVVCASSDCAKKFYSKHSTAKYCSRRCAGIGSMRKPEIAERQRLRMRKYSDEDLIRMLTEQARELSRTPSSGEVKPSKSTYQERFGTYNNAVVLAGLTPNVKLPKQFLANNRVSIRLPLRFAVLKRDGFRCQYCGGTPQEGYILHVDHRAPVSKGGEDTMENLVTACMQCNLGKADNHDTSANGR